MTTLEVPFEPVQGRLAMFVRGSAAVAIVVVLVLLGGFVGFWGAVGLTIVGVDFSSTYLVLGFAPYVGAGVGLVAGLVVGWRLLARRQ